MAPLFFGLPLSLEPKTDNIQIAKCQAIDSKGLIVQLNPKAH